MTIDLNLSADQHQIIDAARALLADRFPLARLHEALVEPFAELAEFGAIGLALPEEDGGAGFSVVEEALLHVELGRHLVGPGLLGAVLAARFAGPELRAAVLGGRSLVALAISEGTGVRLFDHQGASHALHWDATTFRLLDLLGNAPEPIAGIDNSLPMACLTFMPEGTASHDPSLAALGNLLVSAQLLGIAEATRDMAVAYAGLRQQFGQSIGAFQAVKHHCANMAIGTEMLSAQLVWAALSQAAGRSDAEFQIAALWRLAPGVALRNARTCIQIHGGMGFSAECDAHLFLKRAHLLQLIGTESDILSLPAPLSPIGRTTQCARP